MTKIFISYRRQDTLPIAGRIFDRLSAKFGVDGVFMDIDSIPIGVDFHGWLEDEVGQASVVLALIGAGWINVQDAAGQRRLENPDDFVRIEIEAALRRGIPVVPVLIGAAAMPRPDQLPDSLRPLARRNAATVDMGRDFHMHMDRLIIGLERHLNGGGSRPSTPAQPDTSRLRAEGRIEVDAALVHNAHGRWFLPGAGKMEWFQDIDCGPEMVVVPAGSFMMGTAIAETEALIKEYGKSLEEYFRWENPQHSVTLPCAFAIGRHAVTRAQFAAFVNATGHKTEGGAYIWDGKEWKKDANASWRNPGFAQDDSHPVVCVSWKDATAYSGWLSQQTGRKYRLPSEAEWEYACRAGTAMPFWWGASINTDQANYDGNYTFGGGPKGKWRQATVPVGNFNPNPWGLYQVHGNVNEWCEDIWHENYDSAPSDGSVWKSGGDQGLRVFRGGSWFDNPRGLRSARRDGYNPDYRNRFCGVRLARTLPL